MTEPLGRITFRSIAPDSMSGGVSSVTGICKDIVCLENKNAETTTMSNTIIIIITTKNNNIIYYFWFCRMNQHGVTRRVIETGGKPPEKQTYHINHSSLADNLSLKICVMIIYRCNGARRNNCNTRGCRWFGPYGLRLYITRRRT